MKRQKSDARRYHLSLWYFYDCECELDGVFVYFHFNLGSKLRASAWYIKDTLIYMVFTRFNSIHKRRPFPPLPLSSLSPTITTSPPPLPLPPILLWNWCSPAVSVSSTFFFCANKFTIRFVWNVTINRYTI